jgi:outer membrane receptor protein involved in Fe transport
VDLERTKRLNYDALITYYVHPGTALYLGYSDGYENLLLDPADPLGFHRTPDPFHRTSRQFFVKLSYAIHL